MYISPRFHPIVSHLYSAEPVTVVPASADGGTVGPLGATPTPAPVNAVERPRPSADVLNRQASFRGFGKLADNSPFKKQYSLRLNELPSNLQRQQQLGGLGRSLDSSGGQGMCDYYLVKQTFNLVFRLYFTLHHLH